MEENPIIQKKFYVCSYGGCGSNMLCRALEKYGVSYHIHDKFPPKELEYVGGKVYYEWFNGIKIPKNELENYYIIYLYRNPVNSLSSIFRRFSKIMRTHLLHIKCNTNPSIADVIKQKRDLYGLKEFYVNYTTKDPNRNYTIYCVKYEELFERQDELSAVLGIEKLNLVKHENDNNAIQPYLKDLDFIYSDINCLMKKNDFILQR